MTQTDETLASELAQALSFARLFDISRLKGRFPKAVGENLIVIIDPIGEADEDDLNRLAIERNAVPPRIVRIALGGYLLSAFVEDIQRTGDTVSIEFMVAGPLDPIAASNTSH